MRVISRSPIRIVTIPVMKKNRGGLLTTFPRFNNFMNRTANESYTAGAEVV